MTSAPYTIYDDPQCQYYGTAFTTSPPAGSTYGYFRHATQSIQSGQNNYVQTARVSANAGAPEIYSEEYSWAGHGNPAPSSGVDSYRTTASWMNQDSAHSWRNDETFQPHYSPEGTGNSSSSYHYNLSPSPSPPPSPSSAHDIQPLPHPDPRSVWKWLEISVVLNQPMFVCRWPSCNSAAFLHEENASDHIRAHLQLKRYRCTTCDIEFATLQTAKRHQSMQEKSFACSRCDKKFRRKDYCKVHTQRCATRAKK